MPGKFVKVCAAGAVMLAAVWQPAGNGAAAEQAPCQAFRETDKQVCGPFLAYWRQHGGVAQQGFPISGEFKEVSEVDGNTYAVQYFERAVFEMHPENKPPYNVLLSLLGREAYGRKYPNGAPEQRADTSTGSILFRETGNRLGGQFLQYWQRNGGLAQFGYPISNAFNERSTLDGQEYTVQYFERAVFELHPENQAPYDVLLSQLGTFEMKRKYAKTLPLGIWGGDHVGLFATATGATIEYDCAHGTIDQPIAIDAKGNFDATGTHVVEFGGPLRAGDIPDSHPARYTGLTDGRTMTLKITLTDLNQTLGPYVLLYGKTPKIVKCV
jgi:hypothetical protein